MSQNKIEKQSIPVFLNEDGEPRAVIFYTPSRERVIFLVKKADEDEIIALYECKDVKIKESLGGPTITGH